MSCSCTITRHERMLDRNCPVHGDDAEAARIARLSDAELEQEFFGLAARLPPRLGRALGTVLEGMDPR